MSTATLKAKVKQLARDFASFGFVHVGPYRIKRSLVGLDQFIEFQPGHRVRENHFTCNLSWGLTIGDAPQKSGHDHSIRIGELLDGDVWLLHEPKEKLEESYLRMNQWLANYGLPFLDSIGSVEKLVAQCEEAMITESNVTTKSPSPLYFLGEDQGWRHFNLGLAYKHLGKIEKAKNQLKLVIEQHSAEPYGFVFQRKQASERALAVLDSTLSSS